MCIFLSCIIFFYYFFIFFLFFFFFFFFQAEDGIRDHCVTGVQTCALPISRRAWRGSGRPGRTDRPRAARRAEAGPPSRWRRSGAARAHAPAPRDRKSVV